MRVERRNARIPAKLTTDAAIIHVCVTSTARGGVRVEPVRDLLATALDPRIGARFALEIDGFPTFFAKLVWARNGQIGAAFEPRPPEIVWEQLEAISLDEDRIDVTEHVDDGIPLPVITGVNIGNLGRLPKQAVARFNAETS